MENEKKENFLPENTEHFSLTGGITNLKAMEIRVMTYRERIEWLENE